jgi:hypothetical protein
MTSNTVFERTQCNRGPRLAAARASWPATQYDGKRFSSAASFGHRGNWYTSKVISLQWRGLARHDQAAAYERHLRDDTFPALRSIEGFVDATILRRTGRTDSSSSSSRAGSHWALSRNLRAPMWRQLSRTQCNR